MAGTVVSETCDDRNLSRASKAETAQPVAEPNGRDWLRENMEFVSRLLQIIRLIFLRTAARLWRPVSPPPRETIFRRLALKISGRLDEPRAIDVIEGVDVHHRISNPVDHACYDRYHATIQADIKICGLRSESISHHPGVVGDL